MSAYARYAASLALHVLSDHVRDKAACQGFDQVQVLSMMHPSHGLLWLFKETVQHHVTSIDSP